MIQTTGSFLTLQETAFLQSQKHSVTMCKRYFCSMDIHIGLEEIIKIKKENTVKIVTRKMVYITKIMQNTNKMQRG